MGASDEGSMGDELPVLKRPSPIREVDLFKAERDMYDPEPKQEAKVQVKTERNEFLMGSSIKLDKSFDTNLPLEIIW